MIETEQKPILPNVLFLKIGQIIGNKRAKPPIPAVIPVSYSTFMMMVEKGFYPKPVKLTTSKMKAWRRQDILDLVERISGEQP